MCEELNYIQIEPTVVLEGLNGPCSSFWLGSDHIGVVASAINVNHNRPH